jgi:hypothetical protein
VEPSLKEKTHVNRVADFFWSHQLPIGLSLTLFTAADLWFVISNIDSGVGDFRGFYVLMPQWSFMVPVLFGAGLIGMLILCVYCIKGIQPEAIGNKQYAAMLVAALGFVYQVIGAWPLWNSAYPWLWQMEIASYGNLLVLPLFAVSLAALIVGGASLYIHSKIWRQRQAEIQVVS